MKKQFNNKINTNNIFPVLLSIILLFSNCRKWISINTPVTQITTKDLFANEASANTAMTGIYSQLGANEFGIANGGVTLVSGVLADELFNYSPQPDHIEFFNNNVSPSNNTIRLLWSEAYQDIFAVNMIIEQVSNSKLAESASDQIIGQCLFLRAFLHTYLTQLFGDIPYITTTNYIENNYAKRIPVATVYEKILTDLERAASLLNDDYPAPERIRPNKSAAYSLKARILLYAGRLAEAETAATLIIENNTYTLLPDLNNVFKKSSTETIWQLMPVLPSRNTNEGYYFAGTGKPVYSAFRHEINDIYDSADLRRINWINKVVIEQDSFYMPFKYKVSGENNKTEYYVVFRLAEQYLIRAEARARQNNIDGSVSDINMIRERAGLDEATAANQQEALDLVLTERRKELNAEWGHRWIDLRRFNRTGEYLAPLKPGWQATDTLLPIPQTQIDNNPEFGQNSGY